VVAETMIVSGLSGRYAVALFELAKDGGNLDSVAADLQNLKALMSESSDLVRLIRSPVLTREDQGKAMDAVMDKAGFSDITRNFVGLVSRNRRLFSLGDMIEAFAALIAQHRGEISADVTSAQPLNDAQMAEISAGLAKAVGREVNVSASVDESLIGGLVVKVGSRMIDNSIRTKLQNLQLAMKGVG
jgi:F-type H+-transporting ATPase subunit delta